MTYDVIVAGAGNAALCAAIAASEAGAHVLVLERAPEELRGGNTAFTAGAMRVAYEGVDDILQLVPDLSTADLAHTDFGSYSADNFYDDLCRVTQYRTDPDLAYILSHESFDTLRWMHDVGVRFLPIYGRQAFQQNGSFRFWGGLTIEASGGGPGLVNGLVAAAEARDVEIQYNCSLEALLTDDNGIRGVRVRDTGQSREIFSPGVVLACGGFQANLEWRARYLGQNWDLAKVRGTRFNTGDGIRAALEIGAQPWGHWSGCHAVAWDRDAPAFGDLRIGDGFQKHSYPFGIVINAEGKRFLDEGADFRNYTYAKYGRRILEQPEQVAWQVFDGKVLHLLRDEYRIREVARVRADTVEQLVKQMGVDAEACLHTISEFNRAVPSTPTFDPNVKDGRGTNGITPPKSNWANTIDTPPYEAFAVTCGVTFTFGGLHISRHGEVLDRSEQPIPGLYAAGEMVGGLFYFNYPGGSGLTAGSVFGRRAGHSAATRVDRARNLASPIGN